MRAPEFHRAIGKRIAELRRQREYTQTDLARILGVKPQTVFSYELATRRVSLDMVPALMQVFGVSCEQLLGLRPVPRPPARRRTSPAELRHIEHLRQLTRGDRRVVKRVAEALIVKT